MAAPPERADYHQVLLPFRLREAIRRLNPEIPSAAREDAFMQVLDLGIPAQLSANRQFHKLLIGGVPVQYQKDGETRGDFVRLIDWAEPANKPKKNEWLAINQFSIKGPHHTRRPDIILFVNGLPLVLLELKNPADQNADLWKAYDQLQTYKEQIPDVFQYNELLVISENLRVVRDRYTNGLAPHTEVLDAETLRVNSETNHANSLFDAVMAGLRLQRATGEL